MINGAVACRWLALAWLAAAGTAGFAADLFKVATYNLENYVEGAEGQRPAKPPAAAAKVTQILCALNADVLALQEIGTTNALEGLRTALRAAGLDYPQWEHVAGHDTNIFVAVLSRFPIVGRRSHTNESFLLRGRRVPVSRGFAEVDVRVNDHYVFTLIVAHLKSRLATFNTDEAEWRYQEAVLLREKIDARLETDADANLIVVGDFNDTKASPSLRAILGRGRKGLVDTRPAEQDGGPKAIRGIRYADRNVTWTHFYAKEDSYSRIDYILLSRGMAKEWLADETYVLAVPDWGLASDHRPLVAAFVPEDR